MKPSAGFWLLAALLVGSSAQARIIQSFFKVGGTLVLRPVFDHLISIEWKYDEEPLAVWVEDVIPLTYYSRFRGRSELNTTSGALKIHNMAAADTGVYSVEINGKQIRVYEAVEIQEVPQPVVTVRPLMCSSASKKCTLSCDGDVRGAEPVEYFWKKGDGEWEQSEKDMEILNDEETQCVIIFFSCRMKNPVSERASKYIVNPFLQDSDFSRDKGFAALSFTQAQTGEENFKVGVTLDLSPVRVPEHIVSIFHT
ncbi:SLAM family member 9-like [Archocentrus centrarchus]|uniref:SLAM family member 9-like n=1 Tax=Archocentrus centrarchus TaxID=63155 RepID=UPI0011EA3068|nr:SLAM family member 9-like [Archocentrus centrarchus]